MSMEEFASHVLSRAYKKEINITNLQLQKVMYYALKESVLENPALENIAKEIYTEPFQVWRYGPVVPEIYSKFSGFGASSLPTILYKEYDEYKDFNPKIDYLLEQNPFDLVNRSHQEDFWQKNPLNTNYSLEDVING
ncbi:MULTISPECIES: Panacea domain-containing protein [Aerococcus]|uniref:DUF4065 domain-containing protein n=3 Tax=Aerococcus TaxID=1375 RepID=A0A1E9PED0_9LACT|nr:MULTISPECIES: type II toxin-antitoxin system antitoxin SocA domain-containing protein [Aerococcus]KAA9237337.1 DUF4065 domain-containing protein [Aerococcus urinae]KAA9289446.1 DUF4065 domain-containing protein [Aerococcus mictus]KAA9295831.1 DUF4065 domain-containing protein [Aerococcus tenax]MCY3034124.1 DUF4065 domain-containing protein [Aerococcus mictus]MCY3063895.1 DUF4065 domain-containing protein [Aerococcus mictus]